MTPSERNMMSKIGDALWPYFYKEGVVSFERTFSPREDDENDIFALRVRGLIRPIANNAFLLTTEGRGHVVEEWKRKGRVVNL